MTTHHDTMNRLLRALWNRLLLPGRDVARDPQRFGDVRPKPHDLSPCDLQLCWCWDEPEMSWKLVTRRYLSPGDLWLPYSAMSDPSAEP